MKIPSFSKPTTNDQQEVPKDQQWFHEVMEPRDAQIVDITKAVNGRLDRASNLNDELRDIEVLHDTEVEMTLLKLNGYAVGVLPIWNSIYDYAFAAWEQIAERKIRLKVYFSSTPSEYVTVRLLIMGGG